VRWVKLVVSKVLELLTLVRFHPQRKSYHTFIYWCFITACRAVWFFYDHYWQVGIFTCPPRFL